MGRKRELRLDLKPPAMFRCPISLEVMRSPVSLCTGVTYDRSSIQRWLDSGHSTCPATMLPLPSTHLLPNLTLRRLISLWSSSSHHHHLLSSSPPHLLSFLSDPDLDDFLKNTLLLNSPHFLPSLIPILNHDEAAVAVLSLILTSDFVEQVNRQAAISALMSDVDQTMDSLVSVLKNGTTLDARIDAARIAQPILSASCLESRISMAERVGLIPELIRLIANSVTAIDAGLACLSELSSSKRTRTAMARAGAVQALSRILSLHDVPSKAAERAMRLLEATGSCAEGRAAMCEIAEECVMAVVGRMMKVGKEGREAAVGVLWSVCHNAMGTGDRRGREAVAGATGGMAKVLVVMQGDCSPEVRMMAGDLLRVFRIDSESRRELAGYDTKTTHIMPF